MQIIAGEGKENIEDEKQQVCLIMAKMKETVQNIEERSSKRIARKDSTSPKGTYFDGPFAG